MSKETLFRTNSLFANRTIGRLHFSLSMILLFSTFSVCSFGQTEPSTKPKKTEDKKIVPQLPAIEWDGEPRRLLEPKAGKADAEAKSLWEAINFGGEGDCSVKDGLLTIESGDPMTGIVFSDKHLPKTNYEIALEARRTGGIDFFCGLTFPVNDSHCCLIVGGWSGAVVGLSNIDDEDASSNASRRLMTFEDEKWYKIRVRVMPEQIVVWIEDECVIDQNIKGKKISLRGDTHSCRPLGLCTFQTTSETKNMTLRKFKPKAIDSKTAEEGKSK